MDQYGVKDQEFQIRYVIHEIQVWRIIILIICMMYEDRKLMDV